MEEKICPDEEQCEYTWARKFVDENELIFQNNLMRSFLLTKKNCFLLDQSIRYSTFDTKKALDEAFRDHLAEIRLISQLSNDLRRYAIRYDQKVNLYRKRQLLIMDQPINEDAMIITSKVDLIADNYALSVDEEALKNDQHLESFIENFTLYHAIRSLTPRQKYILEASYLFNLTDTEIAAKEGVSQQSISKTRNKALSNLKKQLLAEEGKYE
ncbi:sigma-70 family RNA polymerase sigma factor [Oceanobacillus chungangensis]|uniref:Sigma-70 family RNA polymerase sigma factor n=1 Tax=Oceanobacillus chungangensis TaxID=1229152 RepID=A0A3D8PZW6_9BACI|nr:sigma-70 family RNA polymerase sigma factor [Oceanobacillus chungangensis]RDW20891.1 sigma-70 family RNA polymerase sigma factor [Oceanobacillus chungangensis]